MRPILERNGRCYFPFRDQDSEVLGSEIVYLRRWAECPPRAHVEARLTAVFGAAVIVDDAGTSAELAVSVADQCVATVYVFLTDDGVELSGFATDDHEFAIVTDLEQLLFEG